jgi:hypothetical protein
MAMPKKRKQRLLIVLTIVIGASVGGRASLLCHAR